MAPIMHWQHNSRHFPKRQRAGAVQDLADNRHDVARNVKDAG